MELALRSALHQIRTLCTWLYRVAVESVKDTVDKAVQQVMEDLRDLEYVLAISYPLIDYITSRMPRPEPLSKANPQGRQRSTS